MIIDLVGGVAGAGLWVAQSARAGRITALPPMLTHSDKRFQNVIDSPEYGRGLKADIWAPRGVAEGINRSAPVFLFIPGGAWVLGKRRPQGYALMSHLVEQGWMCVSIEYRTAPVHQWPTPYYDVRRAYKWVRDNIHLYGGNPDMVVVGGASAGGHMAALLGLQSTDDPPEGVVGIYGAYDWEKRRSLFMNFVETVVVGRTRSRDPLTFHAASPLAQVHKDAPPFLLVHGTKDRLCPVGDARRFHDALERAGNTVELAEFPGAGHAFDLTDARRTGQMVDDIHGFLSDIYIKRQLLWKAS